jgi:hypothetical protein
MSVVAISLSYAIFLTLCATVIPVITTINLQFLLQCVIIHLSPLFSSKRIDSARSRSGFFFARAACAAPVPGNVRFQIGN